MWKYASRPVRDTFERGVHFDKCSPAGVVNATGNASDERSGPTCWFRSRTSQDKFRWNNHWGLQILSCSWIDAIRSSVGSNGSSYDASAPNDVAREQTDQYSTTTRNQQQTNGAFEKSISCFNENQGKELKETRHNGPLCQWFQTRKCWGRFGTDNDTNSKRWNFEHLNRSLLGAITCSSAVVLGWYTSQLIHMKLKSLSDRRRHECPAKSTLMSTITPYINTLTTNDHKPVHLNLVSQIEKVIGKITPKVHLVSNEQSGSASTSDGESASPKASSTSNPVSNNDDFDDVLNSIENKLGLAAIESGRHQDGLNLLRSAAHRNHAPALYNLGVCYELGLGVPVNEKTAVELYRSAAALEHPKALYNLGVFYGQGRAGLARDIDKATRLLRLAAVQGDQDAIGALKYLDIDVTEPQKESWDWDTPFENNAPSPTTMFVENVDYLRVETHEATVY